MNLVGKQYGDWLSPMGFNYIVTIRPHFRISDWKSDKMMKRVSKYRCVDFLFYAVEKDRIDNMRHIHLLLKGDETINREKLANMIGINKKAVSYFQEVINPEAVSYYCTKHISYSFSHHNFY